MSERDERMPELSCDAAAAWHAFAGSIAPDDGAHARVLQRVRARTKARRETPDEIEDEPSESQGARRAAAAVLVMKSGAIAVGIAGTALLTIKLVVAAVRPPVAPPAKSVEIVASAAIESVEPTTRPPAMAQPPAVAPQAVPVQAPTVLPTSAKPKRAAASPDAVTPDLLQKEIDLMERVRAAVRAREYARAMELLDRHRTEFPSGALAEERLAFLAIASCELGRTDGRDRAHTFAKSHPRSAQLAAVRAACDAAAIRPMDPAERQQ